MMPVGTLAAATLAMAPGQPSNSQPVPAQKASMFVPGVMRAKA